MTAEPLSVMTGREASIFACLTDAVVAPEPALPPVRETDAVPFFDRWLSRSPGLNRIALRASLHAAELAPRLFGFPARLRRLEPTQRAHFVHSVERSGAAQVRQLGKLLTGICQLAYYGDDAVMDAVGYDADANLRRGRELRRREGRP